MTLSSNTHFGAKRLETSGFTMVELALCIGIIAFAMVAIMGVLPVGLGVQKQNREDTIIDQEGPQWINILRNGQTGWGELTNYLDFITIEHTPLGVLGGAQLYRFPGPFLRPLPDDPLITTEQLVSLLSIPKFEADSGTIFSNRVTAVFRSLAGAQDGQIRNFGNSIPRDQQLDNAFRYQIEVEWVPVVSSPTWDMGEGNQFESNPATPDNIHMGGYLNAYRLESEKVLSMLRTKEQKRSDRDALSGTLYDLYVTFRWPVFRVGNEFQLGAGRRTFRSKFTGRPTFSLYNFNTPESVYWPGTQIRPRRFDPVIISTNLTL